MLGRKVGDLMKGCFRDYCRDDVLLKANSEISIALVPSAKSVWDYQILDYC